MSNTSSNSPAKTAPATLLVVNAGSSSLKFHLYEIGPTPVVAETRTLTFDCGGQISGIGTTHPHLKISDSNRQVLLERAFAADAVPTLSAAQAIVTEWLTTRLTTPPAAVGHRIVHGGPQFRDSVVIDRDILQQLDALAPLAPLHQRNNLFPVHSISERWPEIPQVACFDTAFHRTHSDVVERFALPQSFYERGVRRYGFHGLSYEYIAQRLWQTQPAIANGRVLVAHLGSGASACALLDGRSVETTMGFTALDGLPMGTRPGQLDAGVVLWMIEQGMTHDEIQHLLYNESGLKGLSGLSGDVRDLLASDTPAAALALKYYAYRVAGCIAGLAVAVNGIDALVFTAGVGENSAPVRAAILAHLQWLGVELDAARNAANTGRISSDASRFGVYVEPTNEEWMIANKTLALLDR
jgi:acetate kinase